MSAENDINLKENIKRHVAMVKPQFPRLAVISIGNYVSDILQNSFSVTDLGELALFIKKNEGNSFRDRSVRTDEHNVVRVDEKADTHYWFTFQKHIAEKDLVVEKLKTKPIDRLEGAIMAASTGEGVGSVLLPDLVSRFKEGNVDAVAFAVLPSNVQPADAHYNSMWSMAACCRDGLTQILIDRDCLEGYVGVDRKGEVLKGNAVFKYIMKIAIEKEQFVQEFNELTKSFHLKMFTALSATGASLRIYGSIKNILDAAYLRPLSTFDLSTASMLYVLIRLPVGLKDKLSRGTIELAVDEWFKQKTNLKAAFVSEPVYVDDGSDRLDIVMLVGGFDLTERVTSLGRKVRPIVSYSAKNGAMKVKEWDELISVLIS